MKAKSCNTVNFMQSANDFPLLVSLDKKIPSFGLTRWQKKDSLFFIPSDDEGFSLRGDKRQLLYKGRKCSHRYTIHNDTNFEYDCILLREPESNVITMRMIGAEKYDFFRQPDFVKNPFLKGSYAVYKKETFIGEGTGKLCHIHRPLIIDARGRKIWGELAIVGNELQIIIPENWLAEAKYPVTVDPTVGTTTVGSQWQYYNPDYDPDWDDEEDMWIQEFAECNILVNKFIVPEDINGLCTAYFYAMKDRDYDETDCGGRPVFYSDQNNTPINRKSKQENFISLYASTVNNEGWRSGTFSSNEILTAGSNIWFGCIVQYMWFFRFDYGLNLYCSSDFDTSIIPDIFPTRYAGQINYKVSMYFTYSANYKKTITQGVKLTDTKKLKADYKRLNIETTKETDIILKNVNYKRETKSNILISDRFIALVLFIRKCIISVKVNTVFSRFLKLNRFILDYACNISSFKSGFLLLVKIFTSFHIRDYIKRNFLIKKEEVFLISKVTRELIFDSRLS